MQKVQEEPYWSTPIPTDSQGYTVSFDINSFNPQEVKTFYQQYGLVVFDNILNMQEIQKSISDVWLEVESQTKFDKIDRKDMKTWDNFFDQPMLQVYGFVASQPFSRGEQLWKNRCHPNVYKAFKSLYELSSGEKIDEPMLAMFDRGSLLRPSKNHPEWKIEPLPHFDIDPWWWTQVRQVSEHCWRRHNCYNFKFSRWLGEGCYVPKVRNFTKLQGVLGFSNTNRETGGFQAVCGFHNHIKRWCQDTTHGTNVEDCPDLMEHMQKIFQRSGSIVLFSRELPHGISPNISQNDIRYAQYLRMGPESTLMLDQFEESVRQRQVKQMLPKMFLNSQNPIIRSVFMLREEKDL